MPTLCMVEPHDEVACHTMGWLAVPHNGMAGSETEMYICEMWLREEGFVKTTWKQLPLRVGRTPRVRSLGSVCRLPIRPDILFCMF